MSRRFVLLNATVLEERWFDTLQDAIAGVNAIVGDYDDWSIGETRRDESDAGERICFGRGPIT